MRGTNMTEQANLPEPRKMLSGPAGIRSSKTAFPEDSNPSETTLLIKFIKRTPSIKTISDLCNLTDLTVDEVLEQTGLEKDELFKILVLKQGIWWEISQEETLLRVLGEVA